MRLKILFVTHYLPYPPDRGDKIRDYNIIKRLGKEHEVYLLALIDSREEERYIPDLEPSCAEIVTVLRKGGRPYRYRSLRLMLNIFSPLPFHVWDFRSREMIQALENMLGSRKVDIVQFEKLLMAQYGHFVPKGTLNILDDHDAVFVAMRRYFENETNPLKKGYFYAQWLKVRGYEARACPTFDCCFTVTDKDRKALLSICDARVETVLTGVDIECFKPGIAHRGAESDLVFVGSLDRLRNIDAVHFFYKEIYTLIRARLPSTTLRIVGRNPDRTIRQLAADQNVIISGDVEDVRPYISGAKIMICPVRVGSGIKTKILEAMAMEKPVAATSISSEGVEAEEGNGLLIADTPADFAAKLIYLLENEGARKELGGRGRSLVERKYDWNIITENLVHLYEQLLAEKRGILKAQS